MQSSTVIRPKLKHSIAYMLTDEGLLFVEDTLCLRIKGKALTRWFSRLGPYLNGEHTLEELCQGFDPSLHEKIVMLVDTLIAKGVLKNALPEEPGLLPEAVDQHFRSQIELLDHLADTPRQRFKAFRESRILLVGSGDAYVALGNSLLRNGLRHLFLAPAADLDSADRYLHSFASQVARLSQSGIEASASLVENPLLSPAGNLHAYDIVVYCSENSSLKDIFELNARCLAEQVSFLPAYVFAGQAFIGPFVKSAAQSPCWLCAQMRLTATSDAEYGKMFWQTLALGDGPWLAGASAAFPVTRMLGNNLAFDLFMLLSEVTPATADSKVTIQDIETLEVSSEALLRHPLCPICSQHDEAASTRHLRALVAGACDRPATDKELVEKLSTLIAPRLGLFSAFQDNDVEQIPLRRTTLVMGSPLSSSGACWHVPAYSIDDLREAHLSALLAGVRRYSVALADKREMLCASLQELTDKNIWAISERALTTWSGSQQPLDTVRRNWCMAFSLSGQRLCYIPAAAIYPDGELNSQSVFEKTAAGLAVGTTFRQVLTSGLLSALASTHVAELLRTQHAVIELTADDVPAADPDLTFLLKSAERFECPFTMLEVVHSSPLHLVIIYTARTFAEGSFVSYGYGLSGSEATKMALHNLVAKLQAQHTDGQFPLDQVDIVPLAAHVPYTDFVRHDRQSSRMGEAATTVEALESYLQSCGYELIFADITPADIRAEEMLICGRVVLALQGN
jgi:bacteriocin biosynthesis cyclodehydratase domain-containing protein